MHGNVDPFGDFLDFASLALDQTLGDDDLCRAALHILYVSRRHNRLSWPRSIVRNTKKR